MFLNSIRGISINAVCNVLKNEPKILNEKFVKLQQILDKMIRVDHAGETAAVQIYKGQLMFSRKNMDKTIEHMKKQEDDHLLILNYLADKHRIRLSALLPLWKIAGLTLGATSAIIGREAAMACTEAVEDTIGQHYNESPFCNLAGRPKSGKVIERLQRIDYPKIPNICVILVYSQLRELIDMNPDDKEFVNILSQLRDEELEHKSTAIEQDSDQAPCYNIYKSIVQMGCKVAIKIAEKI
ncbi:Ubiquinone biosynthesis protein COQ7 [Intoshia linei]|uniref:5-demethoxyubiquinone hydroxylase, mitochondrial n=1 Tax=Intoshia linei TaxID=1819745 RepID=A0A177BAI5_9BILA|nr:Ubiquinone biosynthesis protein COQ7 [Intoshia linei]